MNNETNNNNKKNSKRKYFIIIPLVLFLVGTSVVISQEDFNNGINDLVTYTAEGLFKWVFPELAAELEAHNETYMDDDYWRGSNIENYVGSETIISGSDTFTVATHRHFGIPRFGIPTDQNNNVLDTVWYLPSSITLFDGVVNVPDHLDSAVVVYWCVTPFKVLLVNVLTGDTVLNQTHQGQPSYMFSGNTKNFLMYDTAEMDKYGNIQGGSAKGYYTGPYSHPFKTEDNEGKTISYAGVPPGCYFLYTMDVNTNTLAETRSVQIK